MSGRILFVFEGSETEKRIKKSLTQYFVNDQESIHVAYCAEIYQLYRQISNDEFLDTYSLLTQRNLNNNLDNYNRDDFAEIYLFFDYDGHATNANDDIVEELLELFEEETEYGKLYISYPMVESLSHLYDQIEFKDLKVPAKRNIRYKQMVDCSKKNALSDIKNANKNDWVEGIKVHLKKMNFITYMNFDIPRNLITQSQIFYFQRMRYIEADNTVAVLCGFPIFVFDYYGYKNLNNLIDLHNCEGDHSKSSVS